MVTSFPYEGKEGAGGLGPYPAPQSVQTGKSTNSHFMGSAGQFWASCMSVWAHGWQRMGVTNGGRQQGADVVGVS